MPSRSRGATHLQERSCVAWATLRRPCPRGDFRLFSAHLGGILYQILYHKKPCVRLSVPENRPPAGESSGTEWMRNPCRPHGQCRGAPRIRPAPLFGASAPPRRKFHDRSSGKNVAGSVTGASGVERSGRRDGPSVFFGAKGGKFLAQNKAAPKRGAGRIRRRKMPRSGERSGKPGSGTGRPESPSLVKHRTPLAGCLEIDNRGGNGERRPRTTQSPGSRQNGARMAEHGRIAHGMHPG